MSNQPRRYATTSRCNGLNRDLIDRRGFTLNTVDSISVNSARQFKVDRLLLGDRKAVHLGDSTFGDAVGTFDDVMDQME
jgi:hypothetical protein